MSVAVRTLHGYVEMRALVECFDEIWGFDDAGSIPKEVFVGADHAGHQVHGAFEGNRLIGGSWGFLCFDGSVSSLHSHITGVLKPWHGTGAGLALKHAQRDWCRERGISLVTWTFDPMVARNAAFNLSKLGAVGVAFLPDFYGSMHDQFNEGEPTDRIEVHWNVAAGPAALAGPPALAAPAPGAQWVPVPEDYFALREQDPNAARGARASVSARMQELFDSGHIATSFDRTRGYLFTRSAS